jgi:hypothetical protein
MSAPSPPSWQDAINALINAAAAVVKAIGDTVAANASLIATVLVLGAVAIAAISVARRILPGISGFLRRVL